MEKLRIVVGGFIGSFCISGITWHYVQYPVGLQLLGHDVYYVEDTLGVNNYYDPSYEWGDPTPVINYLNKTMDFFGLKNRWAYRDGNTGNCFGLSEEKINEICSTADVIISVSNSVWFREEYMKIPIRVLIDTDPMFTQVPPDVAQLSLEKFTHHFSFGSNIMYEDSKVPTLNLLWKSTVQPICLQYWKNTIKVRPQENQRKVFTTVMNMTPKEKFIHDNEEWGQKDVEFEKILDLPEKVPEAFFEMIVAGLVNEDLLNKKGWHLSRKLPEINNSIHNYSDYIKNSFAEFSVAKETYVKARTGWFSDRSACYLAAGRPAIIQETQWSKYIPSGKGVLSFTSLEDAAAAIKEVVNNYEVHSEAAKEISHEYFDSNKVLSDLITHLL